MAKRKPISVIGGAVRLDSLSSMPHGARVLWPPAPHLAHADTNPEHGTGVAITGEREIRIGQRAFLLIDPAIITTFNAMTANLPDTGEPIHYGDLSRFWNNPNNQLMQLGPVELARALTALDALVQAATDGRRHGLFSHKPLGYGRPIDYSVTDGVIITDERAMENLD